MENDPLVAPPPTPEPISPELAIDQAAESAKQMDPVMASTVATGLNGSVGVTADLAKAQSNAISDEELKSKFGAFLTANTQASGEWLRRGTHAASIQDSLDHINRWRALTAAVDMGDVPGPLAMAGEMAKKSLRTLGTGLAASVATVASVPVAVANEFTGGDSTPLTDLADWALSQEQQEAQRMGEIQAKYSIAGGGKGLMIGAQSAGQAPEMVLTGWGATKLAKAAVSRFMGVAIKGFELNEKAVNAARITSGFIQGSYEGTQATMERVKGNAAAGKSLLSPEDVAVGIGTVAIVGMATWMEGLTGELRMLDATKTGRVSRILLEDIGVQAASEAGQEVAQSVLDDLANGYQIHWDKAAWAGFGGMVGGGMFGSATSIHAISALARDPVEAKKTLTTMATAASAPAAFHNAANLSAQITQLSQAPVINRLDRGSIQEMADASRPGDAQQHFTAEDFATLAEASGKQPEDLAKELYATTGGGMVTVNENVLAISIAQMDNPELAAKFVNATRKVTNAPSLDETLEAAKEMQKQAKELDQEPKLADGTKDDSEELVASLTADIEKAQTGSKRGKRVAAADAEATAALVRATAEAFNLNAVKTGEAKRYTPKQLWDETSGGIVAGEGGGLQQDDRGTYSVEKRIIALSKTANATTFQHELMHHWVEMYRHWAKQAGAPPIFGDSLGAIGAWAGKNAKSIQTHFLKSSNIEVPTADIEAAAADMQNLNLRSQAGRAIHEGITGAYEEYMASGKAPNKGLAVVFNRMAEFFQKVYRVLARVDTVARNTTGTPLLNDEIRQVFDGMYRAGDSVDAVSLVGLTAENTGLSQETIDQITANNQGAIAEAQRSAREKIMARMTDKARNIRSAAIVENTEFLKDTPTYAAKAGIEAEKLDAATVGQLVTGSEAERLDLGAFTTANGADPVAVASKYGFKTVSEMMSTVARAKPIEAAAADMADATVGTTDQIVANAIDQSDINKHIASFEARALKNAIARGKLSDAKKQGKAEKTAAVENAKAATAEQITTLKAEWKAKANQVAGKAKMEKTQWDTDAKAMLDLMAEGRGDAITAAAAARLGYLSGKQLVSRIDAASRAVAKRASKGDFASALYAHLEVLTLAEVQRLETDAVVVSAKTAKAETMESLKKQATRDAELRAELAFQQVSNTPLRLLRIGQWAGRAARSRKSREKALAAQDVQAVLRTTEEIAWAESMEAEVSRTVGERSKLTSDVKSRNTAATRASMVIAGAPTLTSVATNAVRLYNTTESAQREWYKSGGDRSFIRGHAPDLVNVHDAILGLDNPDTRSASMTKLFGIVNGTVPGGNALTTAIARMAGSTRSVNGVTVNGLDPRAWTISDLFQIQHQMAYLEQLAKSRPDFEASVQAAVNDISTEIDRKRVAPKQRKDTLRGIASIKSAVGYYGTLTNLRTALHLLGEKSTNIFMRVLSDAELSHNDMKQNRTEILDPVIKAMTQKDEAAFYAPMTIDGVETSIEQNTVRIMQWGTDTGRNRVIEDLKTSGLTDKTAREFMDKVMANVSQKQVDLIKAMWASNDLIYRYASASAARVGIPAAKKLANTPFVLMVDGAPITMDGGYADVPYEQTFKEPDLLVSRREELGALYTDMFQERVEKVSGKKMILSLDKQFLRQESKMRTAAYMQASELISGILYHTDINRDLMRHYGEDWFRQVESDVRFVFNGMPDASGIIASWRQNLSGAVYAYNATTAIKQPLGVFTTMGHPKVGVIPVIQAMISSGTWGSLKELSQTVAQSTPEMRQRTHVSNDIDMPTPSRAIGKTKRERFIDWTNKNGTKLLRKAQWYSDIISWKAAYNAEISRQTAMGKDADIADYEARRLADTVVNEAQGSSQRSETAGINQGQIGSLATFGQKWMINNNNMLIRMFRDATKQGLLRGSWNEKVAFSKAVFFTVVLGNILFTAANAAIQPEKDDDEDRRSMKDYAAKILVDTAGQPVWWFRPGFNGFYSMFIDEKKAAGLRGYETGPHGALAQSILESAGQLRAAFSDDEDVNWAKALNGALGTMTPFVPGVPSVQIKRAVTALGSDDGSAWSRLAAAVFGYDSVPIHP